VRTLPITAWLLAASLCLPLAAQETDEAPEAGDLPAGGPQLGESLTQTWQVGCRVTAVGGACRNIVAYIPVPIDWPEQQVEIVDEEVSSYSDKPEYRVVAGTVRQMMITIPNLPAGEVAECLITLEITRHALTPPEDTSIFVLPKKLPRDVRAYLGPSPFIESQHAKIRAQAKEATAGKETAWEQVEAMFDWVRENIEPSREAVPLKGAMAALRDGNGDCEDLSSLFIAMCRAMKIPARTVWVPGHCYPEFYLQDEDGTGHWIPCEPHGARSFGGIPEHRPIFQKGDNFKVPERGNDRQRYVAEFMTGERGGGKPSVEWVRQALDTP